MTIKQQGGIFGRNPTFNEVTATNAEVTNQLDVKTISMVNNNPAIYLDDTDVADNNTRLRNQSGIFRIQDVADDGSTTTQVQLAHSTGDLTVSTGNLVIGTSGQGIDFSATSGTGTSELFDDYEEGSYTGTLTPTTSGSITVNAAAQTMHYTKIGRVVFISGFLEVGSASSPVGNDVLLNLPFTVSSLPQDSSRMSSSIYVDNTLVPVRVFNGNTSAYIRRDASLITTGDQFYVSFNYIAA